MPGVLILPAPSSPKDACKRPAASAAVFAGPNGAELMKVARVCLVSLVCSSLSHSATFFKDSTARAGLRFLQRLSDHVQIPQRANIAESLEPSQPWASQPSSASRRASAARPFQMLE